MDQYKKIVHEKDLFEIKFMDAVKAKEEQVIKHQFELDRVKALQDESLQSSKMTNELEIKKRD